MISHQEGFPRIDRLGNVLLPLSVRYYQLILVHNYRKAFNTSVLQLSQDRPMQNDIGKDATKEDIERVYSYLVSHGRLGAHPHQIAKVLNLSEDAVMHALESLQREGKARVRSSNVEWKGGHPARRHAV